METINNIIKGDIERLKSELAHVEELRRELNKIRENAFNNNLLSASERSVLADIDSELHRLDFYLTMDIKEKQGMIEKRD